MFSPKAKDWVNGRKLQNLDIVHDANKKNIWIHCASVGEFEQARPVIEALSLENKYNMTLTFFSPSGYNLRRGYNKVDNVLYLPLDTAKNAKVFLDKTKPELIIFVRYEFWHHYITQAFERKIPTILISATFRKDQIFFKWYGGLFKGLLSKFDTFFLQDIDSAKVLKKNGINNFKVNGDTRIERVVNIKDEPFENEIIESFISKDKKTIIFGSTWPKDEDLIIEFIHKYPSKYNYIIVPHEIGIKHIQKIQASLSVNYNSYSTYNNSNASVLIIDTMGMLSYIFRYADIAYIGGGFGSGIHNTLEPAVYNTPIIIGPKYYKFVEAVALIDRNVIVSINNYNEFEKAINDLDDEDYYKMRTEGIKPYFELNKNALPSIINRINTLI